MASLSVAARFRGGPCHGPRRVYDAKRPVARPCDLPAGNEPNRHNPAPQGLQGKSTGAVPFLTRQTASSAGRHGKTGNGSNLSETNRGKHINDIAATVFPRRHSSLRPPSCGRTGRRTRTAGKCPSTRKPERRTTAGLLTSSDRDTFPTSTNVSGRIARTCNGSYSYGDSP